MNRSRILHIVLILTIGSSALCAMTAEEKTTAASSLLRPGGLHRRSGSYGAQVEGQAPVIPETQKALNDKLIDTAKFGDIDKQKVLVELQKLLAAGAHVNCGDIHGDTPLHYASDNGYDACVQALIAAGADANSKNKKGRTPLYFAAREAIFYKTKDSDRFNCYKNCITLLLHAGASRDFSLEACEEEQVLVNECIRELEKLVAASSVGPVSRL